MILFSRKKRRTLSGKLVMLFIAMAALLIITVGSIIAWSFRTHFEDNIRPHLMQYMKYIRADLGTPPNYQKAIKLSKELSVDIYYFSDSQQWATNNQSLKVDELNFYRQFTRDGIEFGFGHNHEREYLVSRYANYTLAFSIPHNDKRLLHKVIPVLIVLFILVLLYYATRRLFSPINDIKEGINRIGEGELSHRLNIQRRDELGELGTNINAMADDIEQMLEAKRQLLLAISHELRSPLTRAKVATALLEDEKHSKEIQQDLNEMEQLIEELLETERLSTRHSILNKTPTQLQPLITQLLDEHFPNNGFSVDMPEQPLQMELDQARIKLLLKNILQNALTHNPDEASPPSLELQHNHSNITVTIRDHGTGIEAQHIEHLTEPFYRTDKARLRKTGGFGLGLYLCKVIAEAHGGKLTISSQLGKGTSVSIILPVKYF